MLTPAQNPRGLARRIRMAHNQYQERKHLARMRLVAACIMCEQDALAPT